MDYFPGAYRSGGIDLTAVEHHFWSGARSSGRVQGLCLARGKSSDSLLSIASLILKVPLESPPKPGNLSQAPADAAVPHRGENSNQAPRDFRTDRGSGNCACDTDEPGGDPNGPASS